MNCKDEELKAKLYSNRGTAHFYLGEKNLKFSQFCFSIKKEVKRVIYVNRALIKNVYFFSLIFVQVTFMNH